MIFAISAGEECVADGRGRQIVLKSKVALLGWSGHPENLALKARGLCRNFTRLGETETTRGGLIQDLVHTRTQGKKSVTHKSLS